MKEPIKIGRAAVGCRFRHTSGHVYTVLAYVPPGESYPGLPDTGYRNEARYVVASRRRSGGLSFFLSKSYLWLARATRAEDRRPVE